MNVTVFFFSFLTSHRIVSVICKCCKGNVDIVNKKKKNYKKNKTVNIFLWIWIVPDELRYIIPKETFNNAGAKSPKISTKTGCEDLIG